MGRGSVARLSFMMLLVLAAAVALIVWVVSEVSVAGRHSEPPRDAVRRITPEEILSERFARGEIDEDELARRRSLLAETDKK
jgi:uncharacterized membrane protein